MRRLIHLTFALLLGTFALPHHALAAEGTSVRAILISASKGKGGSDPRLAPYESTLRRTLKFDSFKFVGEGSAAVSGNGQASIALGGNHEIQLSGADRVGRGIKLRVKWTHGGRELMNTSFTLQPGVPVVLGRGDEGEVPVVLLIAR